jgi:hypothetical protein
MRTRFLLAVSALVVFQLTSQKLHERIVDLGPVVIDYPRRLAFHVLHQAVQIISRIGYANHADGGAVPQARRIQLRHLHVKVCQQPVFQAANHLPLILERLRRFNAQFEGEKRDHLVVGRQPLVVAQSLKAEDRD